MFGYEQHDDGNESENDNDVVLRMNAGEGHVSSAPGA